MKRDIRIRIPSRVQRIVSLAGAFSCLATGAAEASDYLCTGSLRTAECGEVQNGHTFAADEPVFVSGLCVGCSANISDAGTITPGDCSLVSEPDVVRSMWISAPRPADRDAAAADATDGGAVRVFERVGDSQTLLASTGKMCREEFLFRWNEPPSAARRERLIEFSGRRAGPPYAPFSTEGGWVRLQFSIAPSDAGSPNEADAGAVQIVDAGSRVEDAASRTDTARREPDDAAAISSPIGSDARSAPALDANGVQGASRSSSGGCSFAAAAETQRAAPPAWIIVLLALAYGKNRRQSARNVHLARRANDDVRRAR